MIPLRSRNIASSYVALIVLMGCGGRSVSTPAPADPEQAVEAFMGAVKANDLRRMAELWGDQRGPALTYMKEEQLEPRLEIMRRYLQHERFVFVTENTGLGLSAQRQTLRVRLFRRGCEPVVPFTLIAYREGWLISNIDLGAAGNPRRRCADR